LLRVCCLLVCWFAFAGGRVVCCGLPFVSLLFVSLLFVSLLFVSLLFAGCFTVCHLVFSRRIRQTMNAYRHFFPSRRRPPPFPSRRVGSPRQWRSRRPGAAGSGGELFRGIGVMIMFSHLARVRASNTAGANLFCAGDRPRDINDGGSQKFRVRFEPRTVRLRAHFFVPQAVPSVPQTRVYRGILRVPPITGIAGCCARAASGHAAG
jgi:hypothetical protein